MLVQNILDGTASKFCTSHAVWDRDRWYSYEEIQKGADTVAQWLANHGLKRGERVGLLLKNSWEYIAMYFGILKADGVVVGLNQELMTGDLDYMIRDSEVQFLLTTKILAGKLVKDFPETVTGLNGVLLTEGPVPETIQNANACVDCFNQLTLSDSAYQSRSIDLDLAEIVYTSGSTGLPKGVMLSHLNLVSNMRSIVSYFELTEKDRIMVILPFYYIYGKSLLLTHFMAGGSVVIDNGFMFPEKVLKNMEKTEVTGFAGVPSTFSVILNRCDYSADRFPHLRYMSQAGGALAPSLQQKVIDTIKPASLFVMYGATEAAPRLSWLPPEKLQSKIGSIGIPVDNVELKVVDSEGADLPDGEFGEIIARGSNIMMGYWKDQTATEAVLKNGFYYTGDLGIRDNDGYFFVKGRSKEFLKVRGYRVSAREIEEKLLTFDEIAEAAVIGIPDETLGEAIKAFIVFQKEKHLENEEIFKQLSDTLPSYKLPKYVCICGDLPKNESGKILKTALKKEESYESN